MADILALVGHHPWVSTFPGVAVYRLPTCSPPIPDAGGRLLGEAGEFARIVNGSAVRFLAFVEFSTRATRLRGNHYHAKRTEFLYMIRGRVLVHLSTLDRESRSTLELSGGDLISIAPGVAHAYTPVTDADAVEMAMTPYDADETTKFVIA